MQLVFEFPVNPRYSFENFVLCAGNKTAYQFTQRLIDQDQGNKVLYLFGPNGSGKTHLLNALGSCYSAKNSTASIPYISFKDVDEIYGGVYPDEELSRLAERFHSAPILLIDDIHLLPDQKSIRTELWQVFNDFHQAGKSIAMTGLSPPRELPYLDDHLISRLLWGLVAKIDVSDDESRKMILKKLAEDRHLILPDDVADYLLLHVHRDIPSLLEALEVLKHFALASKRKISVKLAREALAMMGA